MAVTFQVKCGSLLEGGFWLAMPLSQLLVQTLAHASDRAAACVSLDTTTQWQGRVSLWVCHVRTYSTTLPIFYTHTHTHTHTHTPHLSLIIKEERIVTGRKWGYVLITKHPHLSQMIRTQRWTHPWWFNIACNGTDPDKTWVKGARWRQGRKGVGGGAKWGVERRDGLLGWGAFKQWCSIITSSFYIIFFL